MKVVIAISTPNINLATNMDFQIEKISSIGEQPIHLKQQEEIIFHDFYNHVDAYLKDFINFNPLSWFHFKYGVQFQSELSFHFQFFILTKHVQEIWLGDQLLEWLHWKFDIT
jgi:hypothetical protein